MQAAMKGQVGSIRMLLAAGAAVSVPNTAGRTPLLWAAGSGQLAATEALLAAGASTAEADCKGDTALHYAAWAGSVPTIHLLLARSCPAPPELAATDARGKTPQQCAEAKGYGAAAAALGRGAAAVNAGHAEAAALQAAAAAGDLASLAQLLQSLSPNVVDQNGDSALHAAAKGEVRLLCAGLTFVCTASVRGCRGFTTVEELMLVVGRGLHAPADPHS